MRECEGGEGYRPVDEFAKGSYSSSKTLLLPSSLPFSLFPLLPQPGGESPWKRRNNDAGEVAGLGEGKGLEGENVEAKKRKREGCGGSTGERRARGVLDVVRRQSKWARLFRVFFGIFLTFSTLSYTRAFLKNERHPLLFLPPSFRTLPLLFCSSVTGELPSSHPASRNKAFALSTLPMEKLLGGRNGEGEVGGVREKESVLGAASGERRGGEGKVERNKQERDKKTIARIKKLIKYRR